LQVFAENGKGEIQVFDVAQPVLLIKKGCLCFTVEGTGAGMVEE
jgi:hypothetical protein